MALNIKDEDVHKVIKDIAKATGETQAQAVATAVYERWRRLDRQSRLDRMRQISEHASRYLKPEYRDVDDDDLLYDELGLPK